MSSQNLQNTSPTANDVEMHPTGNSEPPPDSTAATQQQWRPHQGWEHNDRNILLVVATLITGLTYQLGTNLPAGYYQEDGHGHEAGDSILRDKHRHRYWLFMAASWVGFGNSMLLTLSLLTGVPVLSRLVRWPFVVAYSSLVLAFITAQPKTYLIMDILLWLFVLFLLWATISFREPGPRYQEAIARFRVSLQRLKNLRT